MSASLDKVIASFLTAVCSIHNRDLTEVMHSTYRTALRDCDASLLTECFNSTLRDRPKWPTPADILFRYRSLAIDHHKQAHADEIPGTAKPPSDDAQPMFSINLMAGLSVAKFQQSPNRFPILERGDGWQIGLYWCPDCRRDWGMSPGRYRRNGVIPESVSMCSCGRDCKY